LDNLSAIFTSTSSILARVRGDKTLKMLGPKFHILKKKILLAGRALADQPDASHGARKDLVMGILEGDHTRAEGIDSDLKPSGIFASFRPRAIFNMLTPTSAARSGEQYDNERDLWNIKDSDFLAAISSANEQDPLLARAGEEAIEIVYNSLQRAIQQKQKAVVHELKIMQEQECKQQLTREAARSKEKDLSSAYVEFLGKVCDAFTSQTERYARRFTQLFKPNTDFG
jgi:hypothetical protein